MRTLRALWGASHPGPSVVVTTLSFALGLAVGLDAWRLALLAVAVLLGQLSIGISNDALDAERDRAVGRRDKPLVRGEVSRRTAWIAAALAVVLALGLSAPLGWAMLLAHAVTIASGWAYNLGLKATPLSVVPFLVSFGLFPSLASLAAPEPSLAAPFAWIAGAALGAAVHLTNVLPDLDDDRRTGIRGLPHRLGATASVSIAVAGIVVAAVAVLLGGRSDGVVPWVFFGAVLVLAVAVVVRMRLHGPDRVGFRLVMAAALLLAAQLVVAAGGLT
ncbi:UbiA family prenyltransferase [Microbacterium radiodurans]|uniref:1,4-dihydroxy-2-naphthoate prenyltransferase n=1 Tax=Microbacterium radiodurans TaxID=661398 RepID=A0A5J5ITU9_9MICO|nr:UbiA family prenyltransferase [Microbacterium radiodurans]KAA9089473.1 1,4-dihydroxy-2-naphthoate prenyltransferase [Microbacterium radiodurans]